MFLILEVKNGICYFEIPEIDKYTHVSVVSIELIELSDNAAEEQIELGEGDEL